MKLATFLAPGSDIPHAGEVRGDEIVSFDDGVTVLDLLAGAGPAAAGGPAHPLADVTLLAPVPQPRAIFGIGLNFVEHIRELGWTESSLYKERARKAVTEDVIAPLAKFGIHPDEARIAALL